MEHLRRLDAGVTRKAVTVAVSVGILGALIMGIGMCCCMVWGGSLMIPGIVIGILGIITVCMAYPLKKFITKRERKKIAPEVIRLTDELMK